MELNTTNPHCFTYQIEELLIELLGIRIDTLDRIRVTTMAGISSSITELVKHPYHAGRSGSKN